MIIVGSTSPSTPAPALSHRGHPPLFLLTSSTASNPSSTVAGNLLLLGAGELFLITSTTASDPSSTAGTLFCPLLLLLGALPHRNKLHSAAAGTLLLLLSAGASTGATSWTNPNLIIMKMMSRRTSALSMRMGTVTIRSFSL